MVLEQQPGYVRDKDLLKVWLYSLSVIFGLGIIIFVVIPVVFDKLAPALLASAVTSDGSVLPQLAYITSQYTAIRAYIKIAIYAVLFGVIVYMFFVVFNKEADGYG